MTDKHMMPNRMIRANVLKSLDKCAKLSIIDIMRHSCDFSYLRALRDNLAKIGVKIRSIVDSVTASELLKLLQSTAWTPCRWSRYLTQVDGVGGTPRPTVACPLATTDTHNYGNRFTQVASHGIRVREGLPVQGTPRPRIFPLKPLLEISGGVSFFEEAPV